VLKEEKIERPFGPPNGESLDCVYWAQEFLKAQPMDDVQIAYWFDGALRAGYRAGAGFQFAFPGDDDDE
jgi:hypothetical protein